MRRDRSAIAGAPWAFRNKTRTLKLNSTDGESTDNRPTIHRNRPAGGLEQGATLSALDQRRTKTRALKQAMMQELLTGRTRLV